MSDRQTETEAEELKEKADRRNGADGQGKSHRRESRAEGMAG